MRTFTTLAEFCEVDKSRHPELPLPAASDALGDGGFHHREKWFIKHQGVYQSLSVKLNEAVTTSNVSFYEAQA